jgi:penicillin-binding protein 2
MKTNFIRFNLLGIIFAAFAIIVVGQIIRIQYGPQADTLKELSSDYVGFYKTVQPVRGQIYDRWGNLLAGNQTVYEVGVELNRVRNPETIALALSVYLGADYDQMLSAASRPHSADSVYALLVNL